MNVNATSRAPKAKIIHRKKKKRKKNSIRPKSYILHDEINLNYKFLAIFNKYFEESLSEFIFKYKRNEKFM